MTLGGFGGNKVSVRIVGDKRDLDKTLRGAGKNVDQFGQRTERSVRKSSTAIKAGFAIVAASAVAVGIKAVKLAADFDSSMSKITGLVGIAADEVDAMGETVKKLAGETARGPAELADALFFVTSAGLRGAEALEALEFAAKASAAGLGDTATVADALTSAMNAYAASGLSAEEATDILVATVREGKLEASALGAAIGQVLPIASEMGVTFDEVGASIAAMTRLGLNSAESVTALKSILTTIVKPAGTAAAELAKVGLSSEGLRRQLREEGLLAVLFTLREAFEGNQEALTKVIPNVRALTGFMALTGDSAEATNQIFENLTDTTGTLETAFGVASDTIEFRLNKVIADSQVLLLKALPLVETLLRELMLVTGAITKLQRLSEITGFEVGSIELAAGAIERLGTVLQQLPRDFIGDTQFVEGVREILEESDLTTAELQRLGDNVDVLRDKFGLTGSQARDLTEIIEDLTSSTAILRREQGELSEEFEGVKQRTQELRDAVLDGLDPALVALRDDTDDATDSIVTLGDAMLAAADPAFNLTTATAKAAEAQANLNEARDEFGVGSPQFLEAANAAAEATARQNAAQQVFNETFGPQSEETFRMLLVAAGLYGDEIEVIIGALRRAASATRNLPHLPTGGGGGGPIGGVRHTGGRVNAPRGQEVLARVLGGEEISNPAHGGNGGGGVIQLLPIFVGSEAALGAELDRLMTIRSRSSPLGFL